MRQPVGRDRPAGAAEVEQGGTTMTAPSDVSRPPLPAGPSSSAGPARILRSRSNRVFAGICGGLAETYGSDPTAVRLLAVILAVFTGFVPVLVIYLIAAIVIPERGDDGVAVDASGARPVVTPGQAGLMVGSVLIGVGVLALLNELYGVDWSLLWPVGLLLLGGALIVAARR
jgi:phage shock protein C